MQQLGQYIVSLTAAAMISGLLLALFPEGTVQKLLRFVCGIFLTVTALAPMVDVEFPPIEDFGEYYLGSGREVAAQGTEMARQDKQTGIKTALETYILDKANALEANVQPEIILRPDGVPDTIILSGSCPDKVRQALAQIITNELGIPEEDQQWRLEN